MHQATDALALLADTEHHHLHGAVQARRLLVPTRTLPSDYDIPRPYGPAPEHCTGPLLARYQNTRKASHQATTSIGRAAHATSAPSRVLTTAWEISSATPTANTATDTRQPALPSGQDQEPEPSGPLQQPPHTPGLTDTAPPARGAHPQRASQQPLTDAAGRLPPDHNQSPATARPQAAQFLRQPAEAQAQQPGPELEPEA